MRGYLTSTIGLGLLLAWLVFPADARPRARKPKWEWGLGAAVGAKYDDNLIGLSSSDRAAFLYGSDPFPIPLKSTDDLESNFEVKPFVRRRLPSSLLANAEYRFRSVHRLRNSFANYQTHMISVGLRPRVTGYSWSLRMRASLLPSFYLRAYRDRDYHFEYHAARYRNADYEALLRYRFWRPLWIEGAVGGGTYYYNRKFTEYDSEYREYRLGASYDSFLNFVLSGSYARRLSDNVGKNQSGASVNSPINPGELGDSEYGDADYHEDDTNLSLARLLPVKELPPTKVSLSYRLRRRVYTTNRSVELDPLHRGRLDKRGQLRCGANIGLSEKVELEVFGVYEERRCSSPVPSVSRVKNFIRREYGVSFAYQLR